MNNFIKKQVDSRLERRKPKAKPVLRVTNVITNETKYSCETQNQI